MTRIRFSKAAENGRRQLAAYTVERFGIRQARRLRDRLRAALNTIAEAPLIGRTREELDPPGHTFRYFVVLKLFVFVYEPTQSGIQVARLLHGARNLAEELERDAGGEV